MSDIEIRLFRCFVTLAEEQHFGRAASQLGISRPALTRLINKLESQVGVKLLARKANRQIVATEAGQRFLAGARDVLRLAQETAAVARYAERGEVGRIELASMAELFTAGLLHDWIAPFKEAHPAIDIVFRTRSPLAQLSGILDNELNAGFGRMPDEFPWGVRGFEVHRQRMVLALPTDHPLARHEAISPASLAHEEFVTNDPEIDLVFAGYTETIGGIGNFAPRVVRRDDDLITVLAYVALGHGIAVVPELAKSMDWLGVVYRDIAADPAPQTSIAFVYHAEPSPSTKLLIAHMESHALRKDGNGSALPPIASAKQNGFPKLAFTQTPRTPS
jgi:DNA-binding transcriptional LysR family regulator